VVAGEIPALELLLMNPMPDIPIPKRWKKLPYDSRGYIVPWFVAKDERGEWDFRMMDPDKFVRAVKERRCWLCGELFGRYMAFVIGPMCAINRNTAEPPCHLECAQFAVRVCPFLTNPDQRRNPRKVHGDSKEPAGEMIPRNPGVSLIWVCESYDLYKDGTKGYLMRPGEPTAVEWWARGRRATRAEVIDSIESGFPLLMDMAQKEGLEAIAALYSAKEKAWPLLPPEEDAILASHG